MIIGIILLLLGIAFLLKNLGVLDELTWSIVWPCILIVVSLFMIFRKKRKFWE